MDQCNTTYLLHADFEAQARATPDAFALRFGEVAVTYSDIKERSDRVASALRRGGIGDGAFIGLHIDRSIDYVICVLGILKANCAVVPLPPAYPQARLVEILNFSALRAVIAGEESQLEAPPGTSVLDVAELLGAGGSGSDDSRVGDPAQPAFVLCSSGSTGKPKMIVRSHRSFFHRLCWTWGIHPYELGERCCQKSAMTTTHAIYELFEPLLRGIPVLIISDEETRDLAGFWDTIRAHSISRLLIVPSALQVSLDMPGFVAPTFKVVVLMGEYVHHRLAGRAIEAFSETTSVYSIYGSTEASSTLLCDLRESHRPNHELPLGRPISTDVEALVLGVDHEPVAPGATGVLHIGGPALLSEYFGDPDLTASVFVQQERGGRRLYDTHDQVRLMADGNLVYVGRTDHTVKVRGFRVDLQEVERALLLHPEIRQAAVVLGGGDAATATLLGFVTPETVDIAEVYAFLRDRLPAYMIPSSLTGLNAFPRTSSGKTDRRALLADYASRADADTGGGSETATEARIREVWRQVLGHGHLRSDSSFFEVGGTSLSAFAAMQRLREAFDLDRAQVPDQAIYHFATVGRLAKFIDESRSGVQPVGHVGNAVLVRLRKGDDDRLPPFFVVSSAGGTLGAYDRLARVLRTQRDVIGIRDPYVWGGREPSQGFRNWVSQYIDAIRDRQPQGPYHVGAYSSGCAFGYEIARRLRRDGQEVALLALIDPFGLDRESADSFGYRILQARFRGFHRKLAVRLEGRLRVLLNGWRRGDGDAGSDVDIPVTEPDFRARVQASKRSLSDVVGFSVLLELNTGLAFGLSASELSRVDPDLYFATFLDRVKHGAPEVDLEVVDRIFCQYYGLQVPAQQQYRLQRYDGHVVLYETDGPNSGILAAQLRPHVSDLRVVRLRLGKRSEETRELVRELPEGLRDHYLSMRDEEFVRRLALDLEILLT